MVRDETDERKGEEGENKVIDEGRYVKYSECDTPGGSGVKASSQNASKQGREKVEHRALPRIPLLDCTNRLALSDEGVLQAGPTSNKKQWKRRARITTDEENQ